jgi:hypothetical protein
MLGSKMTLPPAAFDSVVGAPGRGPAVYAYGDAAPVLRHRGAGCLAPQHRGTPYYLAKAVSYFPSGMAVVMTRMLHVMLA